MKISVLLGTSRPGGIDIAFAGLSRQTYTGEWELILVDARYHKRHSRILDAWSATGCRAPLIHVPNARDQPPPWGTTCAGINTGIMLASGDIAILLLDYAWVPPTWIERHVQAHQAALVQRRIVLAPHDYRPMPAVRTLDGGPPMALTPGVHPGLTPEALYAERNRYDEISSLAEPFDVTQLGPSSPPPNCDPKMTMAEGPCSATLFHTKNESFPVDVALDVGGMDEHYDRMGGPGDPEFAERLERAGLQPWLISEGAVAVCPNPRWFLPNPNAATHYAQTTPGHEWRGTYAEGQAYFEAARNEGRRRAVNPYYLRDKRRSIWWWREAAQERGAVIARNIVTDEEYWR